MQWKQKHSKIKREHGLAGKCIGNASLQGAQRIRVHYSIFTVLPCSCCTRLDLKVHKALLPSVEAGSKSTKPHPVMCKHHCFPQTLPMMLSGSTSCFPPWLNSKDGDDLRVLTLQLHPKKSFWPHIIQPPFLTKKNGRCQTSLYWRSYL